MPVRPETSKRQNRFKIERNMLEEEVVKKFYGENELRRMYLEFFESKGHLKMNSFSLVPHNDNSLLLINAGMAPLKPVSYTHLDVYKRQSAHCVIWGTACRRMFP